MKGEKKGGSGTRRTLRAQTNSVDVASKEPLNRLLFEGSFVLVEGLRNLTVADSVRPHPTRAPLLVLSFKYQKESATTTTKKRERGGGKGERGGGYLLGDICAVTEQALNGFDFAIAGCNHEGRLASGCDGIDSNVAGQEPLHAGNLIVVRCKEQWRVPANRAFRFQTHPNLLKCFQAALYPKKKGRR